MDSSSSSQLAIPMSIVGHAYKLSNCPSTIFRHDTRVYNSSRIDGTLDYPSCQAILSRVLAEQGDSDSLEDCYHQNVIFRFTIRRHLDHVARRDRMLNDHILDRIMNIGLYDWSRPNHHGGGKQSPIQIHYAAVLGMQLWKRIDILSDRVSLSLISLWCETNCEYP